MKLLILIIFSFLGTQVYSQSTFTSIDQAKYARGKELKYVDGTHYDIEISFHVTEGFITLKNKDTETQTDFTNVKPGKEPNTWRAYSKQTKAVYLFSFVTTQEGMCVVMDDDKFCVAT
jgi:hypothetical protein